MEKLIQEYQNKVNKLDASIDFLTAKIREGRKNSSIDIEDLKQERKNAQKDRQIYFQFIKDLESIRDRKQDEQNS